MTTAASSTAVSATASPTAEAERRRRVGRRLAELDALRALMVLVVMFHALQASKGDVDVRALRDMSVGGVILGNIDVLLPIFFILSGFAVYYQLGAAVLQGKPLPRAAPGCSSGHCDCCPSTTSCSSSCGCGATAAARCNGRIWPGAVC